MTAHFLRCPQGSVFGILLFNICIDDFFYLVKDTEICNYAGGTAIFAYGSNQCSILESLEGMRLLLSLWFESNCMNMSEDKVHLLIFVSKDDEVNLSISESLIQDYVTRLTKALPDTNSK